MEVDKRLLNELEAMGFSKARAMKAISSGNSDIEAAINWLVDHENDTATDEMPMVTISIITEASAPFHISDQVKLRAHTFRKEARRNKAEQEKKLEREREKSFGILSYERIRAGKQPLDAKHMLEESERKRFLAQKNAEKEEERRAREEIRQKLHQDKLERRRMLKLPGAEDDSKHIKPNTALAQNPKNLSAVDSTLLPVKPSAETDRMRECLRSVKRRNMEDETKAIRAFQTLLIYVKNVVNNPDDGKFRKIRISNPAFQERIGNCEEGIEFLELCGFERVDGEKFLFLPREKVDMSVLKLAGTELQNALTNPFFGLLSR